MQDLYYVSHNGQEMGPLSTNEIQKKWKSKELLETDFIYIEEKEDWITIMDFLKQTLAPSADKKHQPPKPEPDKKTFEDIAYKSPNIPDPLNFKLNSKAQKIQIDSAYPTPPPTAELPIVKKSVTPIQPVQKTPSVTISDTISENKSPVLFNKGEAHVAVNTKKAEVAHISLIDTSNTGLDVSSKKDVKIKPNKVTKFVLSDIKDARAGEETPIHIEAHDAYGNININYDGAMSVKTTGSATGAGKVHIRNGVGTVNISNKVSESVEIYLVDSDKTGLDVSSSKKVLFTGGPAVKLDIIEPKDAIAGEDWTFTIKAVDKFGNIDLNYNGTIAVNIAGSENTKVDVKIINGVGSISSKAV